jgi:hypothetical protein
MSRLEKVILFATLAASLAGHAHRLPDMGYVTPTASVPHALMISTVSPCVTRDEPFDMDAYNGPFSHLIAGISQKVDRTTVRAPRHHTSVKPCSLSTGEKFRLFVNDSVDPVNFFGIAWSAGESQLERDDRAFGQGAAGYSKRFTAGLADNATGDFFGMFLYPTLFHQDPRYYRVGHGSVDSRIGHALEHSFVAVNDSGKRDFNYSEWFSTVSSKLVGNLYHPGSPRGFGPTASRVGFSVANDMAWDLLREFWPEITHKFRLPFRTQQDFPRNPVILPAAPANNPADTAGTDATTR